MVLVAISMVALVAFVAISVDGGALLDRKRHAQATADAAALAAAESLFRNYPREEGLDPHGSAVQAALSIAALNGFENDIHSCVTVRTSPSTYLGGPHARSVIPAGYAEVSVRYNQPRYFSALIGTGTIPVTARAVARGNWEAADAAILVLDLHEPYALRTTGESRLTVTGAKVVVNSDSAEAASTNGGSIVAPSIDITGGTRELGGKGGFDSDLNYGTPPMPDPLRHLPEPVPADYPIQSSRSIQYAQGTQRLSPGRYVGGISASGQANLELEPGIYIMDGGGFSFSGQGSLQAEGVMIYNMPSKKSDVISITGTGSLRMSPPDSTIYKGLSLFQQRASENTIHVSGEGMVDIQGTFYTASGMLEVGGGGSGRIGSQYISRLLDVVGDGNLRIDYDKQLTAPRRIFQLVE